MTTEFTLLTIPDGAQLEGATRSEIVDQIIAGHGELAATDEGIATGLGLRENHLAHVAQHAQAIVMASLTEANAVGSSSLDDDALTAIYHDRTTEVIDLEAWHSDIPLFLMASAYAPFTDLPRPKGEAIVFLDALNEATFLDSLVAAGFAELYVREIDDEQ